MSYQDPNFSKSEYWKWRNSDNKRAKAGLRYLMSKKGFSTGEKSLIGGKPVSKKALRKNTKRARKLQEVS